MTSIKPKKKIGAIIYGFIMNCIGLFFIGYGIIAMFFNFKAGLIINILGIFIIYFYWYKKYHPKNREVF